METLAHLRISHNRVRTFASTASKSSRRMTKVGSGFLAPVGQALIINSIIDGRGPGFNTFFRTSICIPRSDVLHILWSQMSRFIPLPLEYNNQCTEIRSGKREMSRTVEVAAPAESSSSASSSSSPSSLA